MSFPKWQQRIRANTERIVGGDTTERWGRAYANFLQEQAEQINQVLGKPEHVKKREERFLEKSKLYTAIRLLIDAHPNISAYKAAQLTGGSSMTVWRYMRRIRARFGITRDPKAPALDDRRRVNGQFAPAPIMPEDIDDCDFYAPELEVDDGEGGTYTVAEVLE